MQGYALLETRARASEVLDAVQWKERWRFIEVKAEQQHRAGGSLNGQTASELEPAEKSSFERWATSDVAVIAPASGKLRPARKPKVFKEVTGLVPCLNDDWCHADRYRLVVAGAWRRPDVIRRQEARATMLGLRRACRTDSAHSSLVLSVGDNLSEILASEKGRARCKELNSMCRQACAI